MRRPGYLIAATVLALIVVALWYLLFSPGWIARTGWPASEAAAAVD